MKSMPLADCMMRASDVVMHNGQQLTIVPQMRSMIRSAKRVQINELANDTWRAWNRGGSKKPHAESMRLRLPFDGIWFEWKVDQEAASEVFGSPLDMHDIGVLVSTTPIDEISPGGQSSAVGAEHILTAEVFFKRQSGYSDVGILASVEMAVDDDGKWLQSKIVHMHGFTEDQMRRMYPIFMEPVVMAIALMNCKNVFTESVPHQRTPKKSKPEKIPRLEFHTIKLPTPRGGGGSSASGDPTERAHHLVRGHFKTYTPDSPLMGHVTGTYWWGWQARGSKKNGIIKSDYIVA